MKKYDFQKAKAIIAKLGGDIVTASLGMNEDAFWTMETVYENGKYTRELNEGDEIAGISGSSWATPVLEVELKDGRTEVYACFSGESLGSIRKDFSSSLGCLSGPCQVEREGVEIKEFAL